MARTRKARREDSGLTPDEPGPGDARLLAAEAEMLHILGEIAAGRVTRDEDIAAAGARIDACEQVLIAIPAETLAGVRAKLRCLKQCLVQGLLTEQSAQAIESAIADMERLHARRPRP